MFLEVKNPDGLDLDSFVGWLCLEIKNYIATNGLRDPAREKIWDDYFQTNDLGWVKDEYGIPVSPTVNYIINEYFNHLVIGRDGGNYIITTNSNNVIPGTSITIDTLAHMINNGTLYVLAYPYFDNVFSTFASILQELYEDWVDEQGGEI